MLQHRCAFLQKIANRKISLFNCRNFLPAIFPFSQNALERLYCSVILTAGFRTVFVSLFRNTRVSAQVSHLIVGNETLIFKRFRLFWSRFDSSDCESPSKCFLLSNFDIPAYYRAGFSKRLSTVTSPVSRVPPPPSKTFQSQALIKMATV